jgi:hypothetical protein
MTNPEQPQQHSQWWIVYTRKGARYHLAESTDGESWETKCGHPGTYQVLPPKATIQYPCTQCFPDAMEEL